MPIKNSSGIPRTFMETVNGPIADGAMYMSNVTTILSSKRANILYEYKKNPDLKMEDVESLLGWLKMQPHLPSKITHTPEFFANRNPNSKQLKKWMYLVMKLGLLSKKKYLIYLQDAIPFRLKAFHFVNAIPFMDKFMAIMKPFMKKELMDMRITIINKSKTNHQTSTSIR
ncbi:PREDICTED: uncharacterized protein LOC108566105 [Nicrophorus vespilloides]|uniref:Uncharacterized protein LOC108566105 n=1 Tax=Nicrophorus vespilloides TaxID=110193 RepID=A0ABM1N3B6_NICVS|nr:PREDICTED: uncharacterized protein LOC108566105 [Nicrophorus vespilloides]